MIEDIFDDMDSIFVDELESPYIQQGCFYFGVDSIFLHEGYTANHGMTLVDIYSYDYLMCIRDELSYEGE